MSIIRDPLELSLLESNSLKGISLLLLLFHHLFYVQHGAYDDILVYNHGIVHQTGIACKVCVALFVFLSGYGLAKKYDDRDINVKVFYIERFVKLMMKIIGLSGCCLYQWESYCLTGHLQMFM